MSPQEFRWWKAFYQLERFGWHDKWERTSLLAASAYNAQAGRQVFEAHEFIPQPVDDEVPGQDPEDMDRAIEGFVR